MVGSARDAPPPADPGGPPRGRVEGPWEGVGELGALAFVTLWATGPDPLRDGLFRLRALRRDPGSGRWEAFDRLANPFPAGPASPSRPRRTPREEHVHATQRMAREFGVTGADLEGAPTPAEALGELDRFLDGRPVVVPDRHTALVWWRALARAAPPALTDPATLGALLAPARAGTDRDLAPDLDPVGLRSATARVLGRALDRPMAAQALLAHGLEAIDPPLRLWMPEASAELVRAARLLEHPSLLSDPDELYPEHAALTDGQVSDARRAYATLEDALEAIRPPWADLPEHRDTPPLPAVAEEPAPLGEADRKRVEEVFEDHLPRLLARDGAPSYRAGQHAVAGRIAKSFGRRELLLMHAPTGTGKTLAYLVPTLLWARRHGVRVGVATYTRALQEQAMERDVPVALECLRRVGVPDVSVSLLKGRANYLCWRALEHQLPSEEAPATDLAAWLALALFALGDPDGDLDRVPLDRPLAGLEAADWRRTSSRLVRLVRARTGCCALPSDRMTCAAEAARRRAERAHLVVTNHAFALARREFFRHIVYDECEHLHDVAHGAFSHAVPIAELRELLARLHRPSASTPRAEGRPVAPGALDRVLREALEGSRVHTTAGEGVEARRRAGRALEELARALGGYKLWRDARLRERAGEDGHSLFREFALADEGAELVAAQGDLARGLGELEASLRRLAEFVDELPRRSVHRLRRTLEVLRGELAEALEGVEAWIPRPPGGGPPQFRSRTFHDAETRPRGDDVLTARVLLPHEYLGRHAYPDLSGAVFLSATTWLADGFETAATYLGLTRAAHPAADEEREPCLVEAFRAQEAFDYGRVLVTVPRDAPSVRDKREFLAYTERFVAHLAERTRGRMLVLFTNGEDLATVGRGLEPFFAERQLPLYWQGMPGTTKESLSERFRERVDSVLLGLDTFWYGADFPGHTLEYLVIVRLPYGVPDGYHGAQCAALGHGEQRKQIYVPRALAKFRQGFGRLLRRETDRGCVFLLDKRVIDPRSRFFLRELPITNPFDESPRENGAQLVAGDTERCVQAALAHMEMGADVARRGLSRPFASPGSRGTSGASGNERVAAEPLEVPRVEPEDLPF